MTTTITSATFYTVIAQAVRTQSDLAQKHVVGEEITVTAGIFRGPGLDDIEWPAWTEQDPEKFGTLEAAQFYVKELSPRGQSFKVVPDSVEFLKVETVTHTTCEVVTIPEEMEVVLIKTAEHGRLEAEESAALIRKECDFGREQLHTAGIEPCVKSDQTNSMQRLAELSNDFADRDHIVVGIGRDECGPYWSDLGQVLSPVKLVDALASKNWFRENHADWDVRIYRFEEVNLDPQS